MVSGSVIDMVPFSLVEKPTTERFLMSSQPIAPAPIIKTLEL